MTTNKAGGISPCFVLTTIYSQNEIKLGSSFPALHPDPD